MKWQDFIDAWKAAPSLFMQTLRNMRDAPLHLWIINLLYLGILIAGIWGWMYWMLETPTETKFEGDMKGMSLFFFIFVFIAYRLAWDWILIRLGYIPPYKKSE